MARVFITGSSDGLGRMAAQLLVQQSHGVVLHARNQQRGQEALAAVPGAETVVIGDLADLAQTRALADEVNRLGSFDAVIHNAGVGYRQSGGVEDGLPDIFAVNTLAPYILTALVRRPKRLVYVGSGMSRSGDASLEDLAWRNRPWDPYQAYCDSKLQVALLAFAVARRWPDVLSNVVEPGWVATKMGGPGATDDLNAGYRTQVWLAVSEDPARVTGECFYHMQLRKPNPATRDTERQEKLLKACQGFSAVDLPMR